MIEANSIKNSSRLAPFYFFIIVILFIVIIWYVFGDKSSFNNLPKKIWTYVESSEKITPFMEKCIESWKYHNQGYEIIVLTKTTYKGYVIIPENIRENKIVQTADVFPLLLRLWVLAEHGGLWIDITTLISEPLDNWLFPKHSRFIGFYMEKYTTDISCPIIMEWIMGCVKDYEIIRKWRDEMSNIIEFQSTDNYIESRQKMGISLQNYPHNSTNSMNSMNSMNSSQIYYYAFQKVMNYDIHIKKTFVDTSIIRKAEDIPLKYLVNAQWNSEKAISELLENIINISGKTNKTNKTNKKYPISYIQPKDAIYFDNYYGVKYSIHK
jgi:hypothetical protein